jgi:hypothetical protein
MRRQLAQTLLATVWVFAAAASARADDAADWFHQVQIHGFASSTYTFNTNQPASMTNQYRVFDFTDDSFLIDEVELVALKTPTAAGEAGFRLDLTAGASVPRITAASGLFRDADGRASDIDLHQALVSYIAPLGSGLRFDLGKQITHLGYEVIDGYDGFNDNATRSLLFGYAIPFTQTGLRCGYTFSPRVAGALYVVNGWDNVVDNNRAKSVGAQVALTPSSRVSLTANYIGGAEQTGNDSNLRQVFDLVAVVHPIDPVTLGLNGDYGIEASVPWPDSTTRENVSWKGAALYGRVAFSPKFALIVRAESFDDIDSYRTGTKQKLEEVTLTPEWKAAPGFVLRGDLRFDSSDSKVFEKRGQLDGVKTQPTISVNADFYF